VALPEGTSIALPDALADSPFVFNPVSLLFEPESENGLFALLSGLLSPEEQPVDTSTAVMVQARPSPLVSDRVQRLKDLMPIPFPAYQTKHYSYCRQD
jgi:hypothetical protein